MKDAFLENTDLNTPKFYYNFIGPDSDDHVYFAAFPETQLSLSLAVPAGDESDGGSTAAAAREFNLLGVMERVGYEELLERAIGVNASKDKQVMTDDGSGPVRPEPQAPVRSGPHAPVRSGPHIPVRSGPQVPVRSGSQAPVVGLKRQAEGYLTRMLGLSSPVLLGAVQNPVFNGFGASLSAPPGFGKPLGVSLGSTGEGSSKEKREIVLATGDASPPTNWNAKKLKSAVIESDDDSVVIIPKPMPYPTPKGPGSGSGSDGVLLKGFLQRNMDGTEERTSIVCLCHGQAHTPEEFVKHAGPPGGAAEPKCFVTVSRGDF